MVCLVLLEARIMSVEVLEDIRKELRELRLLYRDCLLYTSDAADE